MYTNPIPKYPSPSRVPDQFPPLIPSNESSNQPQLNYQLPLGSSQYMQYSNGGAYDDDKYAEYATFQLEPTGRSNDFYPLNGEASMHKVEKTNYLPPLKQPPPPQLPYQPSPNHPQYQPSQIPYQPSPNQPKISPSYYSCPVCGDTAIRTCNCEFRDAQCISGHTWHLVQGAKKPGSSASCSLTKNSSMN